MSKIAKIIIAVIICIAVGGFSGFLTADAIQNWYLALNKPSWNPPNWLFAPVWTALYLMMGIAVGIVWAGNHPTKNKALGLFVVQLVLNFFWSLIFFRWQSPVWAFVEIIMMWIAILLTILAFNKINKTTAYLMIPYLLWVSFASFLNFTIWQLN